MEGDSIKVYVRIRPPAKTLEQDVDHSLCLEATSSKSLVLYSKPEPKHFSYDHVADMNTTQVWTVFCFHVSIQQSVETIGTGTVLQGLWLNT